MPTGGAIASPRRFRTPAARVLPTLVLAVLFAAPPVFAWGGRTHEIINRRAAEALTGPAGDAFRPLAVSLGRHASDADERKRSDPDEPRRHYFDADAFDAPPFDNIPRTFEGMERKYGPTEAKSFGTAPWAIEECYRMLVLSLQRGDWASAGAWAADLGHYVGDTHQPLHCTLNYDGQKTGHHGVHIRYEVHTLDEHLREEMLPRVEGVAPFQGGLVDGCLAWMTDAYAGVNPLLAADAAARAIDPGTGAAYRAALWEGTQDLTIRQVDRAIRDLAALYLRAWEEAGSPAGPAQPVVFQAQSIADLEGKTLEPHGFPRRALLAAAAIVGAALGLGAR